MKVKHIGGLLPPSLLLFTPDAGIKVKLFHYADDKVQVIKILPQDIFIKQSPGKCGFEKVFLHSHGNIHLAVYERYIEGFAVFFSELEYLFHKVGSQYIPRLDLILSVYCKLFLKIRIFQFDKLAAELVHLLESGSDEGPEHLLSGIRQHQRPGDKILVEISDKEYTPENIMPLCMPVAFAVPGLSLILSPYFRKFHFCLADGACHHILTAVSVR